MKNYFEKHLKQKLKTQPGKQQPIEEQKALQQSDPSAQFLWTKPNKTASFFKHKHVAKMFTQKGFLNNSKNLAKPNHSLHLKSSNPIDEVNQLSRQQSMRQSDDSLSLQNIKQRGFSLEYLKITKKHKVKSLLQQNLLNNPIKTQAKAWLDSPFENIQLPFRQNTNKKTHNSTRKVLTPLSGQIEKDKNINPFQTQYNQLQSSENLSLFKNQNRKTNSFFKNFAKVEKVLSTNPPRSPSAQEGIKPISFVPIESIKLDSTRYPLSNPKQNKTDRQGNNRTFLKKSKYSPFKSRNGSSASNNGGQPTSQFNVNNFSGEQENQLKSTSSFKQIKAFQLKKHKRLKSHLHFMGQFSQHSQELKPNQTQQTTSMQIIQNEHTAKIIAQGLYGNLKLLNDIKECFDAQLLSQKQEKPFLNKVSQLIKIYVFGEKDIAEKNYQNHLFAHMDQLFEKNEDKWLIKQTICAQRLLIICMVDLIGQEKFIQLFQELKLTIMILIVIYLKIFISYQSFNPDMCLISQKTTYITTLLSNSKLKSRHSIQKHVKEQLLPYVDNLFRHSRDMFENLLKHQIEDSRNRTINRTFYQILKKYAIYLTNNQQKTLKNYNNDLICNFATCPAPYILSKPQKRYTLCIDLDETLLFSNFSCAKRFQTSYRPGAKEFIIQLSKYFEIIVFTSSVKEYADAVIKPFIQFVDHTLYRYHVTRGKNLTNTVKDLSRVGRRLEKVIFIDDLECNTKLQPQNSIKVTPWKGDHKDSEIIALKKLLVALGKQEEEHDDLRKVISEIREKMKILSKSCFRSPQSLK